MDLRALAPDGLDDAHARSVVTWTDAALLAALGDAGATDGRRAAAFGEALRRGLAPPPVPGFSEKLPDWTDRALRDALGPYVREYELPRRAALLLEAERRGLDLDAPPPRRRSALVLAIALVATVIALVSGIVLSIALKLGGDGYAIAASIAMVIVGRWLVTRFVRPWLRRREDD